MPKGLKRAQREREAADENSESDAEAEYEMQLVEEARILAEEQRTGIKKTPEVYNTVAILETLKELDTGLPWYETLDSCTTALELEDAHDDLKREVAFYNHALAGVKDCRAKLDALGEPFRRPTDYFAEMLKSDAHMSKIKDKLIVEQKKIAAVEERKRNAEHKKFAKQVQESKLKDRRDEKNQTLDAVKKWRKDHESRSGALADDDGFEKALKSAGRGEKRGRDDGKPVKSKKRQALDKKYGFGGKRSKKNDAKSTNDGALQDFNPKSGKAMGRGRANKKGGKPNRPGKASRAASRAGKK